LGQVYDYADQFERLRETVRVVDPLRFGHLPTLTYRGHIAGRMTMLKSIVFDSHGVLVTAHALGLMASAPPPVVLPVESSNVAVRFVREHSKPIIFGVVSIVIGAYFTNCFGLTHR
jgi:hypothetical protein